ncbi:MAG: hypothetical protein K0R24_693 [Gammaproteobacteria bacterium]|nr:hypothetical protein [Gammaproteobacteria bacterium]
MSSLMENDMLRSIIRTCSLWFNLVRQKTDWDKHNQILPGLFLGVIPTASTFAGKFFSNTSDDIIQNIKHTNPDKPLGLIVSVVEPDELASKGFLGITMVSPLDWKAKNIKHLLVEMRDFSADVDHKKVITAILQMKKTIDAGESVYIHCKAGRSRSAMLCAVYLTMFVDNPATQQKYTLPEAILFLKNARKQVLIQRKKFILAQKIINEMKQFSE